MIKQKGFTGVEVIVLIAVVTMFAGVVNVIKQDAKEYQPYQGKVEYVKPVG